ncbi:MAG: cytochrome c3 family protein [Gammaproteobacteria bacterium]|nr:cytochrome c3 family protein [Gammaproteobacteria bacterium]
MKTLFRTIPIVALLWMGFIALVQADVAATKHNLSSTQPDTVNNISTAATAFVCGFCHSPHTESGGPAPLWNRTTPAGPYTMYNVTASATMDMTVAGSPASISLACLSCHDGTVGFDQLINGAGSGNYNAAGADQGWQFTLNGGNVADTMPAGGVTNLGTNLTGDHPISVTYDPTADTAFQPLATVQAALQLYGASENQVECASCHNPHESTNPTFLRVGIDTLCTTCHIK